MPSLISNEDLQRHEYALFDVLEHLELESDDEDSIASYSSDVVSDYLPCPAHGENTISGDTGFGSDAGLEDDGESSTGSLDFMQSPRVGDEEGWLRLLYMFVVSDNSLFRTAHFK
jgi:hypothetical protein